MSEPNDDQVCDKETAQEWANYLDHFEAEVYVPVFKPRGYSKDAAFVVWHVNRLRNAMRDSDEDEPWRPE